MKDEQRHVLRRLIEAGQHDNLERYYLRHVLPHDKRSASEILNDKNNEG